MRGLATADAAPRRVLRIGLAKGQWHWAGAHPKPFYGEPIMPNAGYKPTAAEAAQTVENYWDAMKAKNGKKPRSR